MTKAFLEALYYYSNMRSIQKRLIIFDLDGTLAESKSPMDNEMVRLLDALLGRRYIAIISGGAYTQFEQQVLAPFARSGVNENLDKLFLFPTCGTALYRFSSGKWSCVYEERLSPQEQNRILQSFGTVFATLSYQHPPVLYGDVIENRGSQITFSALGQKAPATEKQKWFSLYDQTRHDIARTLDELLPDFEVHMGGLTSIDVTKKGLDKGYGIRQAAKYLNIAKKEMIFVGDALFPGGNDYAAIREGIDTIAVKNPTETKAVIRKFLKQKPPEGAYKR